MATIQAKAHRKYFPSAPTGQWRDLGGRRKGVSTSWGTCSQYRSPSRPAPTRADRAGVPTQWIDCSAAADPPATSEVCHTPLSLPDVVIRLMRQADAPKARFGVDALGFASAVGSDRGAYATVFYDAVAAAHSSEIDLRLSLGHAMAHELGHLFLRSNEHSVTGVMRATWGPHDCLLARSNRVLFLPEQARRIQAEVRSRTANR